MYINAETIIQAASLLTALGILVGTIIAIYKSYERDQGQSQQIESIQAEQTILCYGLLACLKGLQEQGCDGAVTDAVNDLEKHLNRSAHNQKRGGR